MSQITEPTILVEAEAIAAEIIALRCARRKLPPKSGPELKMLIAKLIELKPEILALAKRRLEARANIQRDWISKIVPARQLVSINDLI